MRALPAGWLLMGLLETRLSVPLFVILLPADIVKTFAKKPEWFTVPLLSSWRLWVSNGRLVLPEMFNVLPELICVMPPGAVALPIVPLVQVLVPERISVPPPSMTPLDWRVSFGMVMVTPVGTRSVPALTLNVPLPGIETAPELKRNTPPLTSNRVPA